MVRPLVAVMSLALGLATSSGAAARPNGGGAPVGHGAGVQSNHKDFRPQRHDDWRHLYPYFGYAGTVPADEPGAGEQGPVPFFGPPPEPPRQLNCERSWERVEVPSEAGGVRTIVVTRC